LSPSGQDLQSYPARTDSRVQVARTAMLPVAPDQGGAEPQRKCYVPDPRRARAGHECLAEPRMPLAGPVDVDEVLGITDKEVWVGHEPIQFAGRVAGYDAQPAALPLDLERDARFQHFVEQFVYVLA